MVQTASSPQAEAFANHMFEVLNHGALALMMSIGYRTGLFDVMARLSPSTSQCIAQTAGLCERYVREWLGAMVTGRIVEYDPTTQLYVLPPEHAASLTRTAALKNLAMFMQYIPLLGAVEDGIVRSFHDGGGVPYAAFPRFQQVKAEESSQTVTAALLDEILSLIPETVAVLRDGIDVLDVGCGRGRALNLLAKAFPRSRFTGYDFSPGGIATGREEAQELGLTNVRFLVKDAATIDEVHHYGLVTAFDAIHDQAQPRIVLKRIATAVRPDGVFLMQDIAASSHVHQNLAHPMGPLLYTLSCMHCLTVSLALGGEGLGAMWGEEQALTLLAEAGFTRVEVQRLPCDKQNNYFVAHTHSR